MGSFSKLGIILCCVFGVIILGFVAELSYIFWWKKKLNKNTEQQQQHKNSTRMLSLLLCWKNPISAINFYSTEELNSTAETSIHNQETEKEEEEEDLESGNSRETILKELVEESVEAELIRLHNLCGPPRFLFTINEETKEDLLESEDRSRKGSRRRSLSDLITTVDSPSLDDLNHHHGFNPLFESLSERELNKLRSSPPPKFKFLRDAEEKLMKRLVAEAEKRAMKNGVAFQDSVEEKDGSFIAFLNVKKQREKGIHLQEVSLQNSASSKVLPLPTSPSTREE